VGYAREQKEFTSCKKFALSVSILCGAGFFLPFVKIYEPSVFEERLKGAVMW
jgi:hypothetical protein